MRILFLSQRFLLPMDAGGKIRTGKILEELTRKNDITLVSNFEPDKDGLYLSEMKNYCTKFIPVPWKETRKYSKSFYLRLFIQMFSIYPVSVLNSYSKNLRIAFEKEYRAGNYDVAICDFVQTALIFRNIRKIPALLFQHNVESVIARRHMKQSENILFKIFWWLQWRKMFLFEKRACAAFDTVIAVSDKDQATFQELYDLDNVSTIPTGVDIDYFQTIQTSVKKNSLVFCGSMDWLPNEDAIIFFIKDILPLVKKKISDISLTVVGRNPSPLLQKMVKDSPEIELTGWVEDIRPYIAKSSLYIVPIRIGGGTRMKIYEAMAMGKMVISTSVGAEGLPVKDGKNIVLEDNNEKFAERIIFFLNNDEEREKIALASNTFVRDNFSWPIIANVFYRECKKLL